MRIRNKDIFTAILFVMLNIGWVQLPNRPWAIGIILALPLVLFFPGYLLTQILFFKKSGRQEPIQEIHQAVTERVTRNRNSPKSGHPIGFPDHFVLNLGLSIAIDVLMGFVLNMFPIGLQPVSWAFSLGLLITLFAFVMLFLRRKSNISLQERRKFHVHVTLVDVLLLCVASFIIANSVWLAVIRPFNPQPSFTQFWMLPANATNKTCAVSLGVQSFELAPVKYTIIVTVNDQQVANNWSPITLVPQQKWVQVVPVTPEAQNDLVVAAQLYRSDQPQVAYRVVHLTFHVSAGLQNGQIQQECTLGT